MDEIDYKELEKLSEIFLTQEKKIYERFSAKEILKRFKSTLSDEDIVKLEHRAYREQECIIKEDMICPVVNKHCDDETCNVGGICNMCNFNEERPCE